MKTKGHFILILLLFFISCAPARFVEPLQKKQISIGGNFGGPIIDFAGAPIPVPLSSIEAGYGLDSNLTVFTGIHSTALIFNNFQIDAGLTYKLLNQKKYIPNLSVSPSFNFIADINDKKTKFWPILDINAYWNYGKRNNYFYTGFNNMFELSKTMANEQNQIQPWIFSPQIGHIVKGKSNQWQFLFEIKFLAPNQINTYSFVPYKSLTGQRGATGIYFGFRKIIR